ncbi:MAG: OmpA family protein [Alphaproteobacteria bacterium]|nr:OmpA family protein [Alphaproteobacteria bacterium]
MWGSIVVRRSLKYALLLAALFASACAEPRLGKSLVVVLPDETGKVGAVEFDDGKNKVLLNKALSAAKVTNAGKVESVDVTQNDVDDIFKATLASLPALPKRFRLYFKGDSAALTDASREDFEKVFSNIASRQAYEVEVTGHTDRVGDTAYNETLSIRRATAIRDKLVERGINADLIFVYGRGEWDLLVKTKDNRHEALNRRVEIMVR